MSTSKASMQPTLEPDGRVTCPDCGERINCGPSGLENFKKRHIGSKTCEDTRKRKDKDKKKPKYASILGFMRPKPAKNPPTVKEAALVDERIGPEAFFVSGVSTQTFAKGKHPQEGGLRGAENVNEPPFLRRLRRISSNLGNDVPIASDDDVLAQFWGNGSTDHFDDPSISSDDLWEEVLNPLLKRTLGWGEDIDMAPLVRRGEKGMTAVLGFVEYFVRERGVDSGLLEGKLSRLVDAAEVRCAPRWAQERVDDTAAAQVVMVSGTPFDLAPATDQYQPEVIDVDAIHEGSKHTYPMSHASCSGYILSFPPGSTPHTSYPFALHATSLLPWDYAVRGGSMTLYAHACSGRSEGGFQSCNACRQLTKNNNLNGILTRIADGVHENAQFAYHGFSGLHALLKKKNEHIEFYRLRGLNQARALLSKAATLSEHKRFVLAVASGDVKRLDRVIAVGLRQKKGIRGLLDMLREAAKGRYKPKSWSEEEVMRARLGWRLGGNRVANINHLSRGDPSLTYLRMHEFTHPLIPSHSRPTVEEVSQNVKSAFENVLEVIQRRGKVVHGVAMFDELAAEKRIRWDIKTNNFLGACREHGHRTSLSFVNEGDVEELFRCLDEGEVHYASEATIGALGLLTSDHRIYPARAILESGDCKRETGKEHEVVIQTVLDGINAQKDFTHIRVVSIASDGETRRGLAFIRLTFKHQLAFSSPIFQHLSPLVFMNLYVGDDDLTCDKDWKHVIKRFRNLLLRPRGVVVNGFRITPEITQAHLRAEGATADHIRALFKPDDQQDVKAAFDMLKDIWSLPRVSDSSKRGSHEAREALWILGKLLYHLIFPYLCVDLSLSEQLAHLSAAAHLALLLFRHGGKTFIPTELFIDLMLMIKNVYFCVSKTKEDDPDGSFWIVLLGTDRLEELFGILRTMIGNDSNLDLLQLAERLNITTEVSNILAQYPQWDRGPRRLKVPAITRESKELPSESDHIKPGSWRGDVHVKNVSLLTAWRQGRLLVEQSCSFAAAEFLALEAEDNIDILSPKGVLLVTVPIDEDDVDESLDDIASSARQIPRDNENDADNQIEIEDAVSEMVLEDQEHNPMLSSAAAPLLQRASFSRTLELNGKAVSKARILSRYSKYRKSVSSTDRLRRVQEVERFISTYSKTSKAQIALSEASPDKPVLVISDPIATLLCCDGNAWLAIGEVNSLKIDGESVDFVPHDLLAEATVSISYQLLGLRPATTDDDSTTKFDWQSCRTEQEHSFTVPGLLVQPINPDLSATRTEASSAQYLFDSRVLIALTATLFEHLAGISIKSIPRSAPTNYYPYREIGGKACFICSDFVISDSNMADCSRCANNITLDLSQAQRVLEHIGAHILHDSHLDQTSEPCGLCLQPSTIYKYFVKKGKGARGALKVDRVEGCTMKCNFSYGVAAQSTSSSPCSNAPIICPLCPKASPAVWRYNLEHHFEKLHPTADRDQYTDLLQLSAFEIQEMVKIWRNREKVSVKRLRKSNLPPLVPSDAHRAVIRPNGSSPSSESSNPPSPSINATPLALVSHRLSGARPMHESEADSDAGIDEPEGPFMAEDDPTPSENTSNGLASDTIDVDHSMVTAPFADLADSRPAREQQGGDDNLTTTSRVPVESSGRSKRKRTAIVLTSLSSCVCGNHAEPAGPDVIRCHRSGCETEWYHLSCVSALSSNKSWVCEACSSSRNRKAARR